MCSKIKKSLTLLFKVSLTEVALTKKDGWEELD
jgi:hypothetical protein